MAMAYIDMAEEWFNAVKGLFSSPEKDPNPEPREKIRSANSHREPTIVGEAMEVLRWYQHQIYVKTHEGGPGSTGRESPTLSR